MGCGARWLGTDLARPCAAVVVAVVSVRVEKISESASFLILKM